MKTSASTSVKHFGRQAALCLLGALALGAGNALAQQPTPASPYEFRSGVWLDAERGIAYLMAPESAVEAVDLGTGKDLWREKAMEKPLLASAGWLLGQKIESPDKLSLVMMNVEGQPQVKWNSAFQLPAGVEAAITDTKRSIFKVQACTRGAEIGVVWTSMTYEKPVLIEPGRPESRTVTGNLLVSVAAGSIRESAERACPLPEVPQTAGPIPAPGSTTSSGATVRYPSADGQHYLASRELPTSGGTVPTYQWEIYSTASGERVAQIQQPEVGDWFVVRGANLIVDTPPQAELEGDGTGAVREFEPPRLRALALASGQQLWSHEYRDTRFQGDFAGEEEEDD
jgi:hypothetical protein